MKISNYIIAVFAIVILAGTLGLYIDAKHHSPDGSLETKEYALPEWSVMVATGVNGLSIEGDGKNGWTVSSRKGDTISNDWYQIEGDTLFVRSRPAASDVRLHVGDLTSVIAMEKSTLYLNRIKTKNLKIVSDDSSVQIFDSQIDLMEVQLSNQSRMYANRNIRKLVMEKDSSSKYSLY